MIYIMNHFNYKICIPSYKRCDVLKNQTIKTLSNFNISKSDIHIFVVKDDYETYKNTLGDDYNIIIGVKGLINQRHFIENYFCKGDYLVFLDDDIKNIDLSMTEFLTLQDFFNFAFQKCINENSFIWSVYPVFNPFFRKDRNDFTTHLNYMIGAFYGIINRPNFKPLKLNKYFNNDEKEDVLRTLLYFINDGIVLRFNKIGFQTKYYGNDGGGMGTLTNRIDNGINACKILQTHFNNFGNIKVRKCGVNEFKLKKNKSFNPDRSVTVINIQNYNNFICLLGNLYDELQNINLKPLGKSNVRYNFLPTDRSVVFGLSRHRYTGVVDNSFYTKTHPHIWNLIQKVGSYFPDDFKYNSVFVNKNVVCKSHRDKNNIDKSILVSFGDYTGCNIVIDGVVYNANCNPVLFNGALLEHYNTDDLVGTKYSLVFFQGNY